MARYMLDTNMLIYLIKQQPPQVAEKFSGLQVGDVVMSAITYAELSYGLAACENPRRERRHLDALVEQVPVAPFDQKAAHAYGPIRLATREKKKDQLDKMIAAHAVSLGIPLVTNNVRDFAAYPGLRIENWLE